MKGPFLKSSLVVVEDCHLPGGEGGEGGDGCQAVWGSMGGRAHWPPWLTAGLSFFMLEKPL